MRRTRNVPRQHHPASTPFKQLSQALALRSGTTAHGGTMRFFAAFVAMLMVSFVLTVAPTSQAQAADTCSVAMTGPDGGSVPIYDSFTYNISGSKVSGDARTLTIQLADGLSLATDSLDPYVGSSTIDTYEYDEDTNVLMIHLAAAASVYQFAFNVNQVDNSQKNSDTVYETTVSGCGDESSVSTDVTGNVDYSTTKSSSTNPGSDNRTVHYSFNVKTDNWSNSETFTSWTQTLTDVIPAGAYVTSSSSTWNGGSWSSVDNDDGTTTWTWTREGSYGPEAYSLDSAGTNIWLNVYYPADTFADGTTPPANVVTLDVGDYDGVDTHSDDASVQSGEFGGGTIAKEIAISKLFNGSDSVNVTSGEVWMSPLNGTISAAYINTMDDATLASMTVEDSVDLADNDLFSDHSNQYRLNFTFNQELQSNPVSFTLEYTTNVQTDWVTYDTSGLTTASNSAVLNLVTVIQGSNNASSNNGGMNYGWANSTRLSLPVGEHLTGWRIVLSPDDDTSLNNGAQVDVSMTYIASYRSVTDGETTADSITNTAQASGETVEDEPQTLLVYDAATMNIEDAVPIQTTVNAPSTISVVDGGGEADFQACIANYEPSGKAYSDTSMNVVLPVGVFLNTSESVVANPSTSSPSGLVTPVVGDGVTVSTSMLEIDGENHQVVTLHFDELESLRSLDTAWDGVFCYTIPTTVTAQAFISAGNLSVQTTSWAWTEDPSTEGLKYAQTWDSRIQTDTYDFAPEGWVKNDKIARASDSSTVNIAGALIVSKEVSNGDEVWSTDSAVDTPGTAEWKLTILNGLDSYLTDVVVFDRLPYVGDDAGSTFDSALTGAVTGLPDGATVEYSTNATSADDGDWSDDPTGATAFRVTIDRIESFESFELTFPTNVPEDLLFGDEAFNSATGSGVYHHPSSGATDTVTFASNQARAYVAPTPSLSVVKTTNDVHYDEAPGALVTAGDTVEWSYVVTNTGNTTLNDVSLSDAFADGSGTTGELTPTSEDTGPLAPGESRTFTATGTAVAGQYENTVTATGTAVDDEGVTIAQQPDPATDSSWYKAAALGSLSVTKQVTGDGASLVADDTVFTGTYSYPAGEGYEAGSGEWSTTAGETWTSETVIPEGAVVTVLEDAPDAVAGGTWGTTTISDPVTIVAGETAEVTVENPITVDTGLFSVTKSVTGDGASLVADDVEFTGTYSYPAGDTFEAGSGEWSAVNGETWTSGAIPTEVVVTVVENTPDAVAGATWGSAVISEPVTIVTGETVEVTVENPITVDTGSFTVTKQVTGDGASLVPEDQVFTGTYSYPEGETFEAGSGDWSAVNGETWTSGAIPAGAVVTVVENDPDAVAGGTWTESTVSDPVTIVTGETAEVTVTNTITVDTGLFSVTKEVTGDGASLVSDDQVFTGTYSYPAGDTFEAGDGEWSAVNGETWTSGAIPAGAVVTVVENTPDAVAGGTWSAAVISDPITIVKGDTVDDTATITVENPITVDTGSFTVTKQVTGDGASLVPEDQVFTGTYSYPAGDTFEAGSGEWSAVNGETWTSGAIPAGAVVTVVENASDAVAGGAWGDAIISEPVTIATGETAAVTVENPITTNTGLFSVTKVVEGGGASLVPDDQVFSGTYSYPAGDTFEAGSGEWSGANGETWTSNEIPAGAVVTVVETDPEAVDGATWTGSTVSDPVTIVTGETAEITVTNTIDKDEVTPTNPDSDSDGALATTGGVIPLSLLAIAVLLLLVGGVTVTVAARKRRS